MTEQCIHLRMPVPSLHSESWPQKHINYRGVYPDASIRHSVEGWSPLVLRHLPAYMILQCAASSVLRRRALDTAEELTVNSSCAAVSHS